MQKHAQQESNSREEFHQTSYQPLFLSLYATLEGEEHITFLLRPLSPVTGLRRSSDCLLAFQEGGGGLTQSTVTA